MEKTQTAHQLFKAIEAETGITREQIISKSRKWEYVAARTIIAHELWNNFWEDVKSIERDRTTIIYYQKSHAGRNQYDKKYRELFDRVSSRLNSERDNQL